MQARTIRQSIARTQRTLAASGALLKGSVSTVRLGKRKRGRGERIVYLLTYKGDQQVTRSLYVPKTQLSTVRSMIRDYHQARKALDRLVALNIQLFKTTRPTNQSDSP